MICLFDAWKKFQKYSRKSWFKGDEPMIQSKQKIYYKKAWNTNTHTFSQQVVLSGFWLFWGQICIFFDVWKKNKIIVLLNGEFHGQTPDQLRWSNRWPPFLYVQHTSSGSVDAFSWTGFQNLKSIYLGTWNSKQQVLNGKYIHLDDIKILEKMMFHHFHSFKIGVCMDCANSKKTPNYWLQTNCSSKVRPRKTPTFKPEPI